MMGGVVDCDDWSESDLQAAEVGRQSSDDTEFWYGGDYQALIRHGADLVEDKHVALEDLTLPGWEDVLDEMSETTTEMIGGNVSPEKIQADVRDLREERGVGREVQEQENKPTTNPQEIQWADLWDDFELDRTPLSLTQFGLLAEASPQTGVWENGKQVATEAARAGRLERRGNQYIPEEWT